MIDIIEWLQEFGYGGMFVAAFLAGSFFPFSSEAVMTALSLAGLNVWLLMLYSTLGNTLGGLFNYGVGRLGSDEWVYRLFKLKEERRIHGTPFMASGIRQRHHGGIRHPSHPFRQDIAHDFSRKIPAIPRPDHHPDFAQLMVICSFSHSFLLLLSHKISLS